MSKSRQPTVNDVANLAGVSRATVSLVNQSHARIPKETAERVRAAMATLGYTYNRAAANLRSQTSQALGLIIDDIRNPFLSELTSAVQDAAAQHGLMVYLAESAGDLVRQELLVRSFAEHAIAGLIICPAIGTSKESFKALQNSGIPICTIIRRIDDTDCDFVGSDNYEASRTATEHLIHQGCKSIAYIGGESIDPVRRARYSGYADALQFADLKLLAELDFQGKISRENTFRFVRHICENNLTVDAIVCHNDFTTLAALFELRAFNYRPGADIAVIGFDGTLDVEITSPPASTMRFHGDLIGREAVKILILRRSDPNREQEIIIQANDLVIRESSRLFTSKK